MCVEQTRQMADSCFGLVGPHQCRVCVVALRQPRLIVRVCISVQQESELADLMMNAIKQGLEGLVVKDVKVQITLAQCTLASHPGLGTRLRFVPMLCF